MRLSYLVKGLPGHPLHPPLTDATIGIFVHGMRVLNLVEEPAHRAVAPVAHAEKQAAEGAVPRPQGFER